MAIHKEGYKILAGGFLILLIINIFAGIIWSDNSLVKLIILISSVLFYIFILFFFRLPTRYLEPDPERRSGRARMHAIGAASAQARRPARDLRQVPARR